MAHYELETLGIVDVEPFELLHEMVEELRTPGASRAGVSVASEPAEENDTAFGATDRAMSALDADALLVDWEPCELAPRPPCARSCWSSSAAWPRWCSSNGGSSPPASRGW